MYNIKFSNFKTNVHVNNSISCSHSLIVFIQQDQNTTVTTRVCLGMCVCALQLHVGPFLTPVQVFRIRIRILNTIIITIL